MVKTGLLLLFFILLMSVMCGLQVFVCKKSKINQLAPSSLEAGFESLSMMNYLLSSSLVFLSILFVMFDLEIIFLMPFSLFEYSFKSMLFITWFIIFSLLMEWKVSGLKWYV